MNAEKIIWELPKGLLNWYDFRKDGKVLCITDKENGIAELLRDCCAHVTVLDMERSQNKEFLSENKANFDYIVAVGIVEYLMDPIESLTNWKELLSSNGRLLLGMDNRLGLKYFCGDRDPFTNRSFDGIENYKRVLPIDRQHMEGRNYSREEIRYLLDCSGFVYNKFYTVLPNLEFPQMIYADGYLPKEELAVRYFPKYYYPDSVFLEEELLYTDMIKNGLFHTMANSYFIECSLDKTFDNVEHVTVSLDRGKENALATIIRNNGTVEKRILYGEACGKLERLQENEKDLRAHGINVIESKVQGNSYIMPYIDNEVGVTYLRNLAKTDTDRFKQELDIFCNLILKSSEYVDLEDIPEDMGIILKRGYLDLVPLNCFYVNGSYLFYDQEFYVENYPANAIIFRAIEILYLGDSEMESYIPKKFFWKKYRLEKRLDLWREKSGEFTIKLRHQKELRSFQEKYERNFRIVNTNRQKMNYTAEEYQRIFIDIFKNAEKKKIILFGAGNFTKRFLVQFKKDYSVYAIVDNNSDLWGTKLEDVTVNSPEILHEYEEDKWRIIICIKGYMGIVKQLQKMGINKYCIYDPNVEYPRKQKEIMAVDEVKTALTPKKYHTGYIAGVFDLYHIGHLNMFKRAKELCDYLIVGVVTDEGVRKYKKTEAFIPFEERLELVRSCCYVDEAVEIPLNYSGTRDAYNMYHFDCQFSGSDYTDNPDWLAEKNFLEKRGAELVFFPYTEGTSSTKLKKMIEKSLL